MDVTTHIKRTVLGGTQVYQIISIEKTVQNLAKDITDDLKLPVYR